MPTYIYSPVNEFGKQLIPVGTPRTKASVTTDETIDISWLETIDTYSSGLEDANSKIVLYPALKSAIEYATAHSIGGFKFKICQNGESDLPAQITEETIKELRSTIYLVQLSGSAQAKNKYSEYVCKNTESYSEELKTPVDAEYEELGSINYVLPQATDIVLGGVKLSDEGDENKTTESGYAATPKAIYDLKQLIEGKTFSFTVNDKTISDEGKLTVSASAPLQVTADENDGVTISLTISDATDSEKGVLKLYSSSETATEAEDGSLTAKTTLEEIKKVETKISEIQVPKIVSEEKEIVDGKVTIDKTNIFVLSTFIGNEQFLPQIQKTDSSLVLTFFESGDPNYNNDTQVTVSYVSY